MKLKSLLLLSAGALLLGGCFEEEETNVLAPSASEVEAPLAAVVSDDLDAAPVLVRNTPSGEYLISQFAQNHYDWETASDRLDNVLKLMPDQPDLLKKAMVLAAGSGDIDKALEISRRLKDVEIAGSLSPLFDVIGVIKEGRYVDALTAIDAMPEGGLSTFVIPAMRAWVQAALGEYDVGALQTNTVHLKHAILISDFMDRPERMEPLLGLAMSAQNVSIEEVEGIADTLAYIGKTDLAKSLYEEILDKSLYSGQISEKLEKLEAGQPVGGFQPIGSAEAGAALALYDVAKLLYQESSDESAMVFAHLSLYLNPEDQDAVLLLASIAGENDRYEQAIAYYRSIRSDHEHYLRAQRRITELLEDSGRRDEALTALRALADTHDDVNALIAMGDIHRHHEEFEQAVEIYNEAEKRLEALGADKEGSSDYWHLFYVRGMAHEQSGAWEKAEADLQAALKIQPDHPFVLNYLGYAWADQGINLDQSLEMIHKAVALQPSDGYITDSLGWVYYKLGRYEEAVPYLEKAVELLPYDPVINDHLGDAYWRVGRKLEARFQWQRAENYSDDEDLVGAIGEKLVNGLPVAETVKQAEAVSSDDVTDAEETARP